MTQLLKPVFLPYQSGKTLWFFSINQSGLTVLNKDTLTWVTYDGANLAHYAMTMTEIGNTGIYVGFYPEDFTLDNLPSEACYQQAGVTPTLPDDLPIAGFGQSQGANVGAINWSVPSAANLAQSTSIIQQGVVASGTPTQTTLISNLTNTLDNAYVGRVILFTSGALAGSGGRIAAYNGTTKLITFTAVPTAPSISDEFVIV